VQPILQWRGRPCQARAAARRAAETATYYRILRTLEANVKGRVAGKTGVVSLDRAEPCDYNATGCMTA